MRSAFTAVGYRTAIAVCGGLALVAGCGDTSPTPLAPTPLPGAEVQGLSLACAANVSRQSLGGGPVQVQYGVPTVQGGLAPVTTECSLASGSSFPIGTTQVTCTGRDELQPTARCSLTVSVAPISSIVAFGDSLTAGVTSSVIPTSVQLEPNRSYPARLSELLAQRYGGQAARVTNSGVGGERAAQAVSRFQSELGRLQPDVVLLMEGTNDLSPTSLSPGALGAAAIETMVRSARERGVAPILATIPPQRTGRDTESMVIPYNDLIRQIAIRQNVPLVDVHQTISVGQCIGAGSLVLSCLGDDDLHPTAEGFALIAEAFFNRLVDIYDASPGGP
ncbi:MAG: GDSL-type esterase/lipase family protein [Acidobacteria bacterium]|nr:GDSL-type esterase/lipase family protein [Acidobacteriota bacterium]